ncbi:hypothetical protein DFH06DRAFT_1131239 [Mycena polygramma]|nr:hypothetical protein DFH06DRAFT_1131239 [Mycena polygramma]
MKKRSGIPQNAVGGIRTLDSSASSQDERMTGPKAARPRRVRCSDERHHHRGGNYLRTKRPLADVVKHPREPLRSRAEVVPAPDSGSRFAAVTGGPWTPSREKEEDGYVLVLGINAEHVSTPPHVASFFSPPPRPLTSPLGKSWDQRRRRLEWLDEKFKCTGDCPPHWSDVPRVDDDAGLPLRSLASGLVNPLQRSRAQANIERTNSTRLSLPSIATFPRDVHLSDAVTHEPVVSTGTVLASLLATNNSAPNYGLRGFPDHLCFEFEYLGISGV